MISRAEADPWSFSPIFFVSLSLSTSMSVFSFVRLQRFGFAHGLSGRVLGIHQPCLPLGIPNSQEICSNIAYSRVSTNWSLIWFWVDVSTNWLVQLLMVFLINLVQKIGLIPMDILSNFFDWTIGAIWGCGNRLWTVTDRPPRWRRPSSYGCTDRPVP